MRTRSGTLTGSEEQAAPTDNVRSSQDQRDPEQRDFTVNIPVTSSSITPPKVTSVSHACLVKWKRERREYEDTITARCATTGEDITKALVPVKNTFDHDLLSTLCKYDWGTTVEEVTEERIVSELNVIIRNIKNDTITDIDAIFASEMKMNIQESDVKARIIQYFQRCEEIIMQHGLQQTFATGDGVKEKCKILKKHLQPAALKEEIELHQRFHGKDSKFCDVALYKLVKEKALEQEKAYRSTTARKKRQQPLQPARSGDSNGGTPKDSARKVRKTDKAGGNQQSNKKAATTAAPEDTSKSSKDNTAGKSKRKPMTGCFHCGGDHWLSECTDIGEAEKEAILAAKASKRKGDAKKYRMKRIEYTPTTDSTRLQQKVLVDGVLELPYCADTGSDWNIIPTKFATELKELRHEVEVFELPEPIEARTVGGTMVTATHAVDVQLTLHTAAGPVRCQDTKRCLVIDDEDEFIVGRSLLAEMGIDVDRQLELLAARNTDGNDDPIQEPVSIPPRDIAVDGDVKELLDGLVQDAVDREALDLTSASKLLAVLCQFSGWRLALGNDPPANVPPLRLRLKPDAKPYKCKVRQYSPEKSAFLEDFNNELVRLGWVYRNKESRWACPALPVRKPQSNEFRQTNDYRPVNNMTEPIVGIMPSLQVVLEKCKGKRFYAIFDFIKGFWQLPLHKESQETLSYMTDKGVFTPTRVPQGSTDAALHFQSTVEDVLGDRLHKDVLVWIDDLLVYADTVKELIAAIDRVLQRLDKHGLKLSPKKCKLVVTEVKWCGRVISAEGIGHDPERIEGLRAMPPPTTAAELQQLLCASNWMREGLVDYARVVKPLQERLDEALRGTKRSKRAAAGVQIALSDSEMESFQNLKDLLAHSATLTFPDLEKQLCLLTDASDSGWGLVVTQVASWIPSTPIQEQQHELLVCMGGSFTGSSLNWSIIDKECYPIAHACEKLEYLLLRPQGMKIYCDHRNIIYMFAPSKAMKKHVRGRLLRWSTKLLEYRYEIEHIEGVHNLWADLISRWGGKAQKGVRSHAVKRLSRAKRKPKARQAAVMTPRPLDDSGFVWPTLDEIARAQVKHTIPTAAVKNSNGVWILDERIWISTEEDELILRIMVISHCGSAGHRGMHVMEEHIRRVFAIAGLVDRVKAFCQQYLLCLHVKGGAIIPRPFSPTYHTYERNQALHWDYLSLGESFGTARYVLVLKDEATHFVDLVACDSPTAEVAAAAILSWYSKFGIAPVWISDCGSHFKNQVVASLNRRLKARQDFILAYSPWKNGTIERVNRDITQILKALTLEFKVSRHDWPYLLPLVQSSINHSPVQSLANRAPLELFTGLPCPSALDCVLFPGRKDGLATLPSNRPDIERRLEQLRSSIKAMHKDVESERAKQQRRYQNRHHHERPIDFCVGDYVLRSRVDEKLHSNKLLVTWVGPYRVTASTEFYFVVEHLITGRTLHVHPSRLKFYADDSLEVTAELLEHVSSQGTLLAVEEIVGHRYNADMKAYEVQVKWEGLEDIEASWELLSSIKVDVPHFLSEYVDRVKDERLQIAMETSEQPKKPRSVKKRQRGT